MKTKIIIVTLCLGVIFLLGLREGEKSVAPEVSRLQHEFCGATNIVNELADEVIDLCHQRDVLQRALAREKYRHIS